MRTGVGFGARAHDEGGRQEGVHARINEHGKYASPLRQVSAARRGRGHDGEHERNDQKVEPFHSLHSPLTHQIRERQDDGGERGNARVYAEDCTRNGVERGAHTHERDEGKHGHRDVHDDRKVA